jgi:sulfate adenylyltransferase subunit 1 (EFTu-like GTPase family)
MDLVDFDRGVFEQIDEEFASILAGARVQSLPLSALHGDNVTEPSPRTPWYDGPTLVEHLESVEVHNGTDEEPFRFPVQLVLRPADGFRGLAGQILSGTVRPGDRVTIWPSGHETAIRRIVTWDGDLHEARAPQSVTLVLAHDLDVSRGDLVAIGAPHVGSRFEANLVWMDERPLDPSRLYLLKQTGRTSIAEISEPLALNEIGTAVLSTSRPIVFDPYVQQRGTGSFIVIDPATSFTAGAGMIVRPVPVSGRTTDRLGVAERLAQAAREADTPTDAVAAVRQALEEILT